MCSRLGINIQFILYFKCVCLLLIFTVTFYMFINYISYLLTIILMYVCMRVYVLCVYRERFISFLKMSQFLFTFIVYYLAFIKINENCKHLNILYIYCVFQDKERQKVMWPMDRQHHTTHQGHDFYIIPSGNHYCSTIFAPLSYLLCAPDVLQYWCLSKMAWGML